MPVNTVVVLITNKKRREWTNKNSPMPTCPAFSSVGVPGPLAGRESAPSVALHIHFVTFSF